MKRYSGLMNHFVAGRLFAKYCVDWVPYCRKKKQHAHRHITQNRHNIKISTRKGKRIVSCCLQNISTVLIQIYTPQLAVEVKLKTVPFDLCVSHIGIPKDIHHVRSSFSKMMMCVCVHVVSNL